MIDKSNYPYLAVLNGAIVGHNYFYGEDADLMPGLTYVKQNHEHRAEDAEDCPDCRAEEEKMR